MMRNWKIFAAAVLLSLSVGLVACETKGPMEKAGEKVDQTMEKAGDKLEEAGEKIEEATEK